MALPAGFLELAQALVGARTVSAMGTGAAVQVLAPLYEQAGLPVQRQTVVEDGVEHINILAGPGGGAEAAAARGGLLLVTHLDTVPPGPLDRWTATGKDPWRLTEADGVLYGLGCADVKLDALCKIEAARRLRGRKLRHPFWILGTFGEEVGLRGARHFAASPLFAQLAPRWVLCGEPSELQIIDAHKGYAVVRCTVRDRRARLVSSEGLGVEELTFVGKAAHSSTPHLGVNAIHKALAWAKGSSGAVLAAQGGASTNVVPAECTLLVPTPREGGGSPAPDKSKLGPARPPAPNLWRALATAGALEELWREQCAALQPAQDARFDPPGVVGGMNLIASGSAPAPSAAAAPDALFGVAEVDATFDARLLPQHDPQAFLDGFIREANAWVERLGGGELSLSVSIERNAAGMAPRPGGELVAALGRTLAARGLDPAPRAKPTSTEAGLFSRAGCEAAVFGPGRSTGNAHTANERIEIAQLERACDLYEALLVELCGG